MITDAQRQFLSTTVRTMQIVVGSLVISILTFLLIVLSMPGKALAGPLVNSYLAVGLAAFAIVAAFSIPSIIARKPVAKLANGQATAKQNTSPALGEVGPAVAIYHTTTIIGVAILEGAAFYNVLAYLLERQSINIATAGVLIACMLAKLPTPARVEDWVLSQLASISQLRDMRGGDAR